MNQEYQSIVAKIKDQFATNARDWYHILLRGNALIVEAR